MKLESASNLAWTRGSIMVDSRQRSISVVVKSRGAGIIARMRTAVYFSTKERFKVKLELT